MIILKVILIAFAIWYSIGFFSILYISIADIWRNRENGWKFEWCDIWWCVTWGLGGIISLVFAIIYEQEVKKEKLFDSMNGSACEQEKL